MNASKDKLLLFFLTQDISLGISKITKKGCQAVVTTNSGDDQLLIIITIIIQGCRVINLLIMLTA